MYQHVAYEVWALHVMSLEVEMAQQERIEWSGVGITCGRSLIELDVE